MPLRLLPILLCAALAACDARIDVELATADLDGVSEVNVVLDGIDLLDDAGELHMLDTAEGTALDLRSLGGGQTLALIDGAKVQPGRYTGLRLRFADPGHELVLDDGTRAMLKPSTAEVFADIDLDIDDDQTASLVATLDLRFSLQPQDDGSWSLQQVLRGVEDGRAASIGGRIDTGEVEGTACTQGREAGNGVAVYLFAQALETPVDYLDSRSGPVASAVAVKGGDGYDYDLPYLHAGSYRIAWTCDADQDRPESEEGLMFRDWRSVTVNEGEAEIVDF